MSASSFSRAPQKPLTRAPDAWVPARLVCGACGVSTSTFKEWSSPRKRSSKSWSSLANLPHSSPMERSLAPSSAAWRAVSSALCRGEFRCAFKALSSNGKGEEPMRDTSGRPAAGGTVSACAGVPLPVSQLTNDQNQPLRGAGVEAAGGAGAGGGGAIAAVTGGSCAAALGDASAGLSVGTSFSPTTFESSATRPLRGREAMLSSTGLAGVACCDCRGSAAATAALEGVATASGSHGACSTLGSPSGSAAAASAAA
mmetsp:Transcript_21510/g.59646  ORF Transcript_21510/g.59646 Transcript_21510/m.59646 type:complete len:256 (+) Transcript_21510:517-1284(+)